MSTFTLFSFILMAGTFLSTDLLAEKPPKEEGGFREVLRGDVPEGAAEMVTSETEKAIDDGLEWLAKQQLPNGSFGTGSYVGNPAVTALAGLAFMASGSSPGRGPYGPVIDKAIKYILDIASPSGFLHVGSSYGPMYSHGFATLFLAEAYGMSHSNEIREKLQKAVRLIIDSQNREGGWRYQPVPNDADLSVTICQINALRAARNAGLYVPKKTVESCIAYVKSSQNPDGGFRYMLNGGMTSIPLTAAGLVALYSAGEYDSKEVSGGLSVLRKVDGSTTMSHYYYGHYYIAQAMWTAGGEDWNRWYPIARDALLKKKGAARNWSGDSCQHYATAMALIVLQMPNNMLPIFQR